MRKPNVNSRLARARAVTGLDQSAFADFVGISEPQLAHIERGGSKGRPLTPDVAAKIAAKAGISADWLLGADDFKMPLALDGSPYTQAKYVDAKILSAAVRLGHAADDWPEVTQLRKERDAVMDRRVDAWTEYLSDVLGEVLSQLRDTETVERLGAEILEVLRSHAKAMRVSIKRTLYTGVDDVMRELGKTPKGRK